MVKAAANCKSSFSLEKTSDVFDTCLISLVWTRSVSLDFAPVGKIKTESEVKTYDFNRVHTTNRCHTLLQYKTERHRYK